MNPAQKSPEGGRSARHPPPHPTHQSRRPAAAAFGIREAARAPRSPRSPRSPRTKAELARAAQKSPEGGRRPGGEQVDPPTTRRPPESTGVSHSGPLGIGSHLITKVIYKKKGVGWGPENQGGAWLGAGVAPRSFRQRADAHVPAGAWHQTHGPTSLCARHRVITASPSPFVGRTNPCTLCYPCATHVACFSVPLSCRYPHRHLRIRHTSTKVRSSHCRQ